MILPSVFGYTLSVNIEGLFWYVIKHYLHDQVVFMHKGKISLIYLAIVDNL